MLNVGLIAKADPLRVRLTDFSIPTSLAYTTAFALFPDGTGAYVNEGDQFVVIPGIWYLLGDTPAPGNLYQIRCTLQAGSASQFGTWSPNLGAWGAITNGYGVGVQFNQSVGGRVLVEVRDIATQQVRASARVWRGAAYAP